MAQFQPGQARPPRSGRKRGTRNKRSQHLADVLDAIGCSVPERLVELLPQLSPEKRADVLINLMSFLYPKRKAVEVSETTSQEQRCLKIKFVSPNKNVESLK